MPRERVTITGHAAFRAYENAYRQRPEVKARMKAARALYRAQNLEAIRKRDREARRKARAAARETP